MDFYSHLRISEKKANELLDTGEWQTDIEIFEIIRDRCLELHHDWGDWASAGEKHLLHDLDSLDIPMKAVIEAAREVSHNHLSDQVETHLLPLQNYNDGLIAVRIKPYAIYRLGDTTQSSVVNILSVVLALSTASPYPFLLAA